MSAPLLLTLVASAAVQQVGVLPIKGRALESDRRDATKIVEQALAGLPDIQVVSFRNVEGVLGVDAARRIEACLDDACFRNATRQVPTNFLIAGELDVEEQSVLRLRLLETATTAPPIVRVTKTVEGGRAGLVRAVSAAVAELFPERAKSALGTIVIRTDFVGASVFVDGVAVGETTLAKDGGPSRIVVRTRPGSRQVVVQAPGHNRFETVADVIVGRRTDVDVSLDKNRSSGPLVLGGVGLVAAGIAMVVGASIKGTTDNWEAACTGSVCDPGFTRARFESDRDAVARGRLAVNGLIVLSAAALVGAVVWYALDPGQDPEVIFDGQAGGAVGWSW